ncbi:phosphate/phosphite/phosphonate ABC transporter substrate-binding protein [Alteribacillus sp. HJP-4]|uniref:phosphate/phosphite/phosphonate ABC transporter substrate-binding protein n=1 Tax=Alteribacillus sp. HJP-4 TaxID=2775394 RepID=UPI0035CD26C5
MKKFVISLAAGSLIALSACGSEEENTAEDSGDESSGNEESSDSGEDSAESVYDDDGTISIAAIPAQSSGEMDEGLQSLEDTLNESMKDDVEVELYPNYNAVVEALNYGHIDLAYLGPLTYVIANDASGAEAILTQEIDGEPYYYSEIITQADREWENLDDMLEEAGEVDFAFGSISSTSGSLIPGLELMERGAFESENEHEFANVQYTGSHDVTASAVESGDVDAGAIDSAIYNELVEDGAVDDSQLKTIWQSERLYQYPWAVPAGMDDETKQEIQEAFTAIDDEEILDIFGGANAFIETEHENYESITQAAQDFGMLNMESIED